MQCKTCEYPLWNLKARECPECGSAFRPSEFEFTLNSVRFCCPHCGQDYYGTGDKGHLVPASFACVSCFKPVTMDECVLLPTAGVAEEQTRADDMPWLERSKRGIPSAWFATIGRSMVAPSRLMKGIPVSAPSGIIFGSATLAVFLALAVLPFFVLIGGIGVGVAGSTTQKAANILGSMAGGFGVALLSVIVGGFLLLAITTLCAHGVLRITGAVPHPLRRTCQALTYSAGANALLAIPCLSVYFGWLFVIWWLVAAIIMLRIAQNVSAWRATLAVLMLPGLIFLGGVVTITIAVASGTNNFTITPPVPPALPAAPAKPTGDAAWSMALAIRGHAETNGGQWPLNPAVLADSGMIDAEAFFPISRPSRNNNQVTLPQPPSLNDAVYAVRVGDFVFTYYHLNLASGMPSLWTSVLHPPQPYPPGWDRTVQVTTLDGLAKGIPAADFPAALATQNILRQAEGLPPLPHPDTITKSSPFIKE